MNNSKLFENIILAVFLWTKTAFEWSALYAYA